MKKIFITVFAVAAYCLAAPYTGLLKNLNIATLGVLDDKKFSVDFATAFRTSMEKYVSKNYPGTTYKNSYSNKYLSDVKRSFFKEEMEKEHNIFMFFGHGHPVTHRYIYNAGTSRERIEDELVFNNAVMYDGDLPVEDMTFSEKTYFAFFYTCSFLSFYTDHDGREKYGFYYRYKKDTKPVEVPITDFSYDDADGWEDSQDAKPQKLAYGRFKNAFKNGLHGMFGFSSSTYAYYVDERRDRYDTRIFDTFAKKWVEEGLRIWQAYKYAVWKHIYIEGGCGIEPAVIFRKGTAIGNDGKSHSFKGYCEYYKSIYQGSMKVNSLSALALGRKKAVYGFPSY